MRLTYEGAKNATESKRAMIVLTALAVLGCGSGDSDDGGGSGGNTGTAGGNPDQGFTDCGVQRCQPGQHCNNLVCVNGCASDVNCASGQTCQDIDADLRTGTCQGSSVPPPTKDCDAYCAKAAACQSPTVSMCEQECAGFSSECVACVVDSNCGDGCETLCGF
jgi:hypothetical protein